MTRHKSAMTVINIANRSNNMSLRLTVLVPVCISRFLVDIMDNRKQSNMHKYFIYLE
nr:hypothetical protein [Clostridium sp.]MBK5234748.1 hypothetical protein [Clostridium sp.]